MKLVTIRKISSYHLGEKVFQEHTARTAVVKEEKNAAGTSSASIYLFGPDIRIPEIGDRIVDDGTEHEIISIKFCRDITGKLRGIRCTALN